MEGQENLKTIKMYMDALIGLHTRLERGGLTKANLTNEVMNITQKITEKADNIEKHVKKSTEEIQKKDNKIRDPQKYKSTLSTKLTQMKMKKNLFNKHLMRFLVRMRSLALRVRLRLGIDRLFSLSQESYFHNCQHQPVNVLQLSAHH